ncbi:MAG: nitrogen regulatory protein [Peptococcaceae bacterium]|jgi:nitrogen regulatory protein PII 1|nr:nitrogen regulatory protein [Peptococcaceae bacterium]
MIMIRAIVRPEKTNTILAELNSAGFPAVTKIDVVGRGKQKGVRIGDVIYDEIPKEMLMMVVRDEDKEDVINIILKYAKTGEKGNYGDGKIFVSPVEEVYTISSGKNGL